MLLQNTIKIIYMSSKYDLFICTSQLTNHFLANLKGTLAVSLNNDIRCCFILCSSLLPLNYNILILVTVQADAHHCPSRGQNGLRVFQKNNLAVLLHLSHIAFPYTAATGNNDILLDCISMSNCVSQDSGSIPLHKSQKFPKCSCPAASDHLIISTTSMASASLKKCRDCTLPAPMKPISTIL